MNQIVKKVNEEKVLFFDLEVVRRNKELDPQSREFKLFQKKVRDRETDELLPTEDVQELYKKRAALKMCYMKVVSIGVGFIKDRKVHIKALEGDEESILKQFCNIANSFDYVCGANILGYDLPVVAVNSLRYFDITESLADRFLTSGKKPWNLDRCLDLMDIFRGTHYANTSLEEMCYHFDLPSSKSELDGSMVSEEYWNNGLEKINKYVKQDVFASVNVFKRMRFEESFKEFIDKNETVNLEPFTEEIPILQQLNILKGMSETNKDVLKKLLKKKKLAVKDRDIVFNLIKASMSDIDINFGKVKNEEETNLFINQLREELENN